MTAVSGSSATTVAAFFLHENKNILLMTRHSEGKIFNDIGNMGNELLFLAGQQPTFTPEKGGLWSLTTFCSILLFLCFAMFQCVAMFCNGFNVSQCFAAAKLVQSCCGHSWKT